MIVARHRGAAATDQEVEVAAVVGLQHVVEVEPGIAALGMGRRRGPGGSPRREGRVVHVQMQAAGGDA